MCRPRTFCCCLSLRTGAILTACLLLLEAALALSFLSWSTYVMTRTLDVAVQRGDEGILILQVARAFLILAATVCGIAVMINIILLAGAINMRRLLVFSWLVGYVPVYSLVLILGLLAATGFFLQDNFYVGTYIAAIIAVNTVISCYLWVVVRSLHCDLKDEHSGAGKVYHSVPSCEGPIGRYSDSMPMAPPNYSV